MWSYDPSCKGRCPDLIVIVLRGKYGQTRFPDIDSSVHIPVQNRATAFANPCAILQ